MEGSSSRCAGAAWIAARRCQWWALDAIDGCLPVMTGVDSFCELMTLQMTRAREGMNHPATWNSSVSVSPRAARAHSWRPPPGAS